MLKQIANVLTGALLLAGQVQAQQVQTVTFTQGVVIDAQNPGTWPATFESAIGPYAWLTPADAQARGLSLANAVVGGQEGTQSLPVCRAPYQGGVHPGKYWAGNCNIGYGGSEVAISQGIEVLYQTQPQLAQYLPQTWVAKGTAGTLVGGQGGTLQLKVCRASHQGGTHPGKEVSGNCNIGYGGQEVAVPQYELLALSFDQAGWQAAQTQTNTQVQTTPMVQTYIMQQAVITDPSDPNTWPATFDGVSSLGPYAWVDGPTALQSDPQLANGVYGGQVGNTRQAVCRANFPDGVHPGKFVNGQCYIGYGGKEVVLTKDYQVLVNTQPQQAPYLTQRWAAWGDGAFSGGTVGGTQLSVCQTWTQDGTHLGKVWEGKCYIGWGGEEKSDAAYGMLFLEFDKAAWQAAQPTATPGLTIPGTVVLNTNLTLNQSTTTITPVTDILTEGVSPDMLSYADAVRRSWTPESLGKGLIDLTNSLPVLMNALVAKYDALIIKYGTYKDGAALLAGVRNGEANAEGPMVNLLVGLVKEILDRDPATWSKDEASLIQFTQCLAQNQRKKTATLSRQAFDSWYASEQEKSAQSGLVLLANVITDPPPEILAVAQKGYSVPPQYVNNYSGILAASAGFSSGMLTFAAGMGTGAGLTFMTTFVPSVQAAVNFGRAAISGVVGGSGAFAVFTMLITAGVIQTIDVIKYEEYVKNLNDAIAALQQPVSANQLKGMLSNTEEGKAVYYWFIAQAATK